MYPKWNGRAGSECRLTHPSYTDEVFNTTQLQPLVDKLADTLAEFAKTIPFDAIAGSGFSGALVCAALSYKMGIPLIAVRKRGEEAATPQPAQGLVYSAHYVIIDDLISSGSTARRIMQEIQQQHDKMVEYEHKVNERYSNPNPRAPEPPKCVGIMLYHDYGTTSMLDNLIPIWRVASGTYDARRPYVPDPEMYAY